MGRDPRQCIAKRGDDPALDRPPQLYAPHRTERGELSRRPVEQPFAESVEAVLQRHRDLHQQRGGPFYLFLFPAPPGVSAGAS